MSDSGHATIQASVAAEEKELSHSLNASSSSSSSSAASPALVTEKGAGSGGYDTLVVGAGLSGAVIAREAAQLGKKVLVVDKRNHIAGNCYDFIHTSGFRVAEYGPHFFHTNSARVKDYVTGFSEWTTWEHRVMARLAPPGGGGDVHVPVPVNIDTVNKLFGLTIKDEAEMNGWLASEQIPCAAPANSRDVSLSRVGSRLYELLFRGYTRKQWAKWPEELEASVMARIPVRNNRDDRYFTDSFQGLPRHGYTAFVGSMLDHPNIEVRQGVDYFAERASLTASASKTYFTGPVDHYFAHLGYDALEYRTCNFVTQIVETEKDETLIQPTSQVNYPTVDVPYTRITEYKHLNNQETPSGFLHVPRSTLVTEYSSGEGDPFYPVPAPKNRDLYEKYKAAAAAEKGVIFVGRLANFKYYNMDAAILNALECADVHVHNKAGAVWAPT